MQGFLRAVQSEYVRLELTYQSNAAEGNSLTLRGTPVVLKGLTVSGVKSLKELGFTVGLSNAASFDKKGPRDLDQP